MENRTLKGYLLLLVMLLANQANAEGEQTFSGHSVSDELIGEFVGLSDLTGTSPKNAESLKGLPDSPTAFDFDGDGNADLSVRRVSNQLWYILNSSGSDLITQNSDGISRRAFGSNPADIPVPADYDGDGVTDLAVRRTSTQYWYILNSSGVDAITGNDDGITRKRFGNQADDIPVPADYDGDGKADLAVRRPDTQYWYILNSSGNDPISDHNDGITRRQFGIQEADIPVPADYDGDGKADLAVRRPDTQYWYILNSSGIDELTGNNDGITRKRFGLQQEDIPVPADYDGDGKTDLAVRRPSNQQWYILNSSGIDALTANSDGITRRKFGVQQADIPVPADYDGDSRADIAVRRPGTQFWYILNSSGIDEISGSSDGITRWQFGRQDTDIPVMAPISIRMQMLANVNNEPDDEPANLAPEVDAGANQTVDEQSLVVLSGSVSDTDGTISNSQWLQISGTQVSLDNPDSLQVSFTAPDVAEVEELIFQLTATDDDGATSSDSVSVVVRNVNQIPVADAGPDQLVDEQSVVTLSGSGSDADGTVVSYQWAQTSGTTVTLDNANQARTTFTAPDVTADEVLSFELTVTDNDSAAATDSVNVTISPINTAPVANAGEDQTVVEGSQVTLSGDQSEDDVGIVVYRWEQMAGTTVTLDDEQSIETNFTAPYVSADETLTFRLLVADREGQFSLDEVDINITNDPTLDVDAGADQTIDALTVVNLSGSSEISPEDIAQIQWSQIEGDNVAIVSADYFDARFLAPDVSGETTLVFSLVITDTQGESFTDTTSVTVTPLALESANDFDGDGLSNAEEQTLGTDPRLGDTDLDGINDALDTYPLDPLLPEYLFFKISEDGSRLSSDAENWHCVLDAKNSLMWEVKTSDGGLQDRDSLFQWYNPDESSNGGSVGFINDGVNTFQYVNDVNSQGVCGYSDWRLPNRQELRSIVDFNSESPAIDVEYFPNTQNTDYWSASPVAFRDWLAWSIDFHNGRSIGAAKETGSRVRLVRHAQ